MKEKVELPVVGRLVECRNCGRKILVEQALFGVDHTYAIQVTCWECLAEKSRKWATEKYKLTQEKA